MSSISNLMCTASVIMLVVSAISVFFPENKYRKHLIFMTKIIVISAVLSLFCNADITFDADFSEESQISENILADKVHDTIKKDIEEYTETLFDTDCKVEITDDEIIVYISGTESENVKQKIYEKFGISCKVINSGDQFESIT